MHNTRENTHIKNIIFHTHMYTVYTPHTQYTPKHPPGHTLINSSFGTRSGSFQNTEFGTCKTHDYRTHSYILYILYTIDKK